MMKRTRKFIIALTALLPMLLCVPPAHGLHDQWADCGEPVSGTIEIDRSAYADGSVYDNPPADMSVVRVGLDFGEEAVHSAVFINRSGAGFEIGQYDGEHKLTAECVSEADAVTVYRGDGLYVVNYGTGELLYYANGGRLALMPVSEGQEGTTEYNDRCYRGGFECLVDGTGMSVINYVTLEDYVKGVVPYEMSASWDIEALKAQAVCARTYAVYNRGEYEEFGFDIRDDTYSQVYNGVDEANENSDSAADSTAGQLVRYKGEVCEIYYFAADGGATEDGSNVFDTDRPYLQGRYDPFEKAVDNAVKDWTAHRSRGEVSQRLWDRGFSIGTVKRIEPELSRTGNVIALSFYDGDGDSVQLEGRSCYNLLRLNSCRFRIAPRGDGFDFIGHGWGHSCGMSQWGAYAMASVYGYDYEDIIRFYFIGAYIA